MLHGQRFSCMSSMLGLSWNDTAAYPAVLDYALPSTTTYKLGIGFVLQENAVPDTVYAYLTADNLANIQAELWSDDAANARPSAKLTNSNTVTLTTPKAGVMAITGLAGTATGSVDDRLWLVLSTPSGTPAGSIRLSAAKCQPAGISRENNMRAAYTTSWASSTYGHIGIVVQYPSGYTDGLLVTDLTDIYATLYGTTEKGVNFISPDCWLSISGVTGLLKRTGTSTHLARVKLIVNGRTYTSAILPSISRVLTGGALHIPFYFDGIVKIPPRSNVWVMFADPDGTASNYYRLAQIIAPTAIGSLLVNNMRPMKGTWRGVSYDGSAFTYTENYLPFVTLITTQNEEVLPSPLDRRQFNSLR